MASAPPAVRLRALVRGLVQGVGFRPFVYREAKARGLAGSVRNTAGGVVVEAEGPEEEVRSLLRALREEAPPLAQVDAVGEEWLPAAGLEGFRIRESGPEGEAATAVPPDVAVCGRCLAEMADPADRRHRHPFVNCTDCGPRFSLVEGVPYDRSRTTMRAFEPCAACAAEYADPASRRFHAEPVACPRCGPTLRLEGGEGPPAAGEEALRAAGAALAAGRILGVKGIGGFHLAADAAREEAVAALRLRKGRGTKPFAVMVPDPGAARRLADLRPGEERALLSAARPVVLLRRRADAPLAPSVAPGLGTVGVMLPAAPHQHLLLEAFAAARGGEGPPVLVMTSGNLSEEPIARTDGEARERLAGLADLLLLHDREILARCDDSVLLWEGRPRLLRRSRGFVPLPLALPRAAAEPVLALGGDLKGCFCIVRGSEAFPGPHAGDLGDLLSGEAYAEGILHLARLLGVRPRLVVHDLHPDYGSCRIGRQLAEGPFAGARLLGVQHHHAHALSCLAENGRTDPALALALDGAGWGPDGTTWGGELLLVDGLRFRRLAHLSPMRLPGGDAAAREPWRTAVAALCDLGAGGMARELAPRWPSVREPDLRAVLSLCRGGARLPLSTSTRSATASASTTAGATA